MISEHSTKLFMILVIIWMMRHSILKLYVSKAMSWNICNDFGCNKWHDTNVKARLKDERRTNKGHELAQMKIDAIGEDRSENNLILEADCEKNIYYIRDTYEM